jgi:E3 ubiquitin-protein ligase DOA10
VHGLVNIPNIRKDTVGVTYNCILMMFEIKYYIFICFSFENCGIQQACLNKYLNLIFMFPCLIVQFTKMANKMQLCRIIYYSLAALHVSSGIFAHYQEHLNFITAFGITHVCRCRLVSWECCNCIPTLP